MPRPKRNRAPRKPADTAKPTAPIPKPPARAPSSDLYDDIDDSRITIVEDNSFKGTGRSIPTQPDGFRNVAAASRTKPALGGSEPDAGNKPSAAENVAGHQSSPEVELSRHERTPPRRTFGPDVSGLDLDDYMFGADPSLDTSFEDDGNERASASKSHSNSSFTISNIRRRARSRTSSFLGANTASIRPSSRGQNTTTGIGSTLNLGKFKRREREPSILGTAQKKRSLRLEDDGSSSEVDDTLGCDGTGEVEDTTHQDEESPLRRKSGRVPGADAERSSSEIDISEFQSKKRKISDACPDSGDEERPSKAPSLEPDRGDSPEVPGLASSSVPASPRSPSPVLPIGNHDEDDPNILAPPASSEDDEDNNRKLLPPLQTNARRRRPSFSRGTPPPMMADNSESELSSPPSLTHSPNYPPPRALRSHMSRPRSKNEEAKEEATAEKDKPNSWSTAELAAMLARRRRKQKADDGDEEDDYDTTYLRDEEYEFSHSNAWPTRRGQPAANTTATAVAASSRRPSSRGAGAGANGANSGNRKKPRRTYGKASLGGKENNEEEEAERSDVDGKFEEGDSLAPSTFLDEPSEVLEKRVGTELKQAKRKFQEVDKWDLVFEEVARSSSPVGAR